MFNRAVIVHVAVLLVLWPSQKIRQEIICAQYPFGTRIIVLIQKDIYMKWNAPVPGSCTSESEYGAVRIKAVTGVRG
ncbi:hypothetical protein DVB37_19105 [Achromobacter sp. B7]|nr:hypothetical protein DVB37_19105 [Achromobacter sp. B7]